MEGRILHQVLFFLLCVFFISGTSIAEKTPSKGIKEAKKLNYQATQTVSPSFTTLAQKDTLPGNVPNVNPTAPGATPTSPTPTTTSGTTSTAPASSGGAWCIASPTASDTALQVALDYACGYGGADCSTIQPNGACYDPNTVRDHASYAFNDYYQKNPIPTSCVFGGTAQLSNTDPSHRNCHFASPTRTPTTTPSAMPTTPSIQTPPSTINPYAPTRGNGLDSAPIDNDYGSEPTGTSNSAQTISQGFQFIITIIGLALSLAMASFV